MRRRPLGLAKPYGLEPFPMQPSDLAPNAHKRAPAIVRRAVRRLAAKPRSTVRTEDGGAYRDRTDDPLLAKQVLSQLSYSPVTWNRHA